MLLLVAAHLVMWTESFVLFIETGSPFPSEHIAVGLEVPSCINLSLRSDGIAPYRIGLYQNAMIFQFIEKLR
jgi:hypothetical protein